MSGESDTPRTDAEMDDARNVALGYECSFRPDPKQCEVVHADFARSLERELNEVRQQCDRLAESLRVVLEDVKIFNYWLPTACLLKARAALAEVEGKEGA